MVPVPFIHDSLAMNCPSGAVAQLHHPFQPRLPLYCLVPAKSSLQSNAML
jgi:hypothetical protein